MVADVINKLKIFSKAPKYFTYCCSLVTWFPLGWFLDKIPSFKKARIEQLSRVRGNNPYVELWNESKIWYFLNQVYARYFNYKIRNLPQPQWQQQRWEEYAEIYYSNRASDKLLPKFEEFLEDGLGKFNISSVLDIGCGGGVITRVLCEKYPEINFTGIDITDKSLEIYNKEIKPIYKNFTFIQGSIFDHLEILKDVQLFYTYNVFMHFDELEIRQFFQYISELPHRITGILQEPYTVQGMTRHYPSAPKDYCHNFNKYIQDYNFILLNADTTDTSGIFYFTTK